MNESNIQSFLLVVAAGAAVIAALAPFVIARFSLFAEKEWWHLKAKAYQELIEVLAAAREGLGGTRR